jgi:predicted DNA-binding transcriptional regulator YafY
MARSENQKQKVLALLDILKKNTDDEHGITMVQIISELESKGIKAERKAIYADINVLKEYGFDIQGNKESGTYYYKLIHRSFELSELKLLVDAVQASKFISQKRSNELIKKIEDQASKYQAMELQRQVYVANRVKTNYDSVLCNVDDLNLAINHNCKIQFDYYEWTLNKQMKIRENGHKTDISPWALTWDDENYYMVAFDGESGLIKHYRVDKMRKIKFLEASRDGKDEFKEFDMALYAKKMFGMFTGDEQRVKIQFDNKFIGVVIDRFGKDIMIVPKDNNTFTVNVNVSVSNMFFSWIIGLGKGVKILGPENVVEKLKGEIVRLKEQYEVD